MLDPGVAFGQLKYFAGISKWQPPSVTTIVSRIAPEGAIEAMHNTGNTSQAEGVGGCQVEAERRLTE